MNQSDLPLNRQDPMLQDIVTKTSGTPAKKITHPALMVTGIIIGFMLFGIGGYYLGGQDWAKRKTVPSPASQDIPATKVPTSPAPAGKANGITEVTVAPPQDWSYRNNGECGVKFAIPPKKDPYYQAYDPNRPPSVTEDKGSGRFWDFPRGAFYPNLLSKLAQDTQGYKQAAAAYAAADEASGYISSAVVVSCISNPGNLDNAGMLDTLKVKIQAYNRDPRDKGMEAASYRISSVREVSRWGRNVYDISLANASLPEGQANAGTEDFTMFATPKYVYEVRMSGMTNDTFVRETAQQIFRYLSFE